jgi:hypothetical protein
LGEIAEMGTMKPKEKPEPEAPEHDPSKLRGKLKPIGGSISDDWNNVLANQAIQTLWKFENADAGQVNRQRSAALSALIGIAPRDECEGMIAGQLVACHNAAMECYRRAMMHNQTFEGRQENLNQANKLSRTYTTLLEALNRHRGKGQQKVTVEHVHVHEGGQAIVGNVEGGGGAPKLREQAHALGYAPSTPMPSADTPRDRVPVTCNAERSMPDARRNVTRGSEGK